jgi:hypothetical protein
MADGLLALLLAGLVVLLMVVPLLRRTVARDAWK